MKMTKKKLHETINEAALLTRDIKALEEQLKPLKTDLTKYAEEHGAESINTGEAVWAPTVADKRADADPVQTLQALIAMGLGDRFPSVVKVQATALTKLIGEEKSEELRPVTGKQVRHTFK